jgi:predicted HTH domain antitoxin
MRTLTIDVPDELSAELEPYRDRLGEFLAIALREVRMAEALALYRRGGKSLWKAARTAGVSLREMTQYAVAHGVRAPADEQTLQEELA